MKTYLAEVQHAASSLIPLIWAEHEAAETAAATLRRHEAETARGYRRAAFSIDNDLDDDGLGTATYWDTYFGPDKHRHQAVIALADVQATLDARAFSRSALASSLLQYAKQAVSAVHGGLAQAPDGRAIHGIKLKELIWQGRNQSSHWEEGKLRQAVVVCFESLKAADPAFTAYLTSNLAFEIVRALNWKDWGSFETDMNSLG